MEQQDIDRLIRKVKKALKRCYGDAYYQNIKDATLTITNKLSAYPVQVEIITPDKCGAELLTLSGSVEAKSDYGINA